MPETNLYNLRLLARRSYNYLYNQQQQYGYGYRSGDRGLQQINTDVDSVRPELDEAIGKYTTIRDCLLGEDHIKSKGDLYLPRPNEDSIEIEDQKDYVDYLTRATFLGATASTQQTVVGKLFAKSPTIDLPIAMQSLLKNVNGEGLAFDQLIEKCVAEVFAFGRCGLYADFRTMEQRMVSIADVEQISPTICFVKPEDIINWRIDRYQRKLMMVVIREHIEAYDRFAVQIMPQYRVMVLEEGKLVVRVYQQTDEADRSNERFKIIEEYMPMLPNGMNWMEIPFAIVGSTNNDWEIDQPPLYSIATYDIHLYRNSADVEQAAYKVGQPTPYAAGMDEGFAEELGINRIRLGSSRFIPFPDANAKIGLLQTSPHTMYHTLMEQKFSILRDKGAIFDQGNLGDNQTATGAIYQALQIHAPLITTSRNVVEAVRKAVGFAAMFIGVDPESEEIEVKLNSDILDNPLGVTGIQTALQLWQAGAITWEEFREQLSIQDLTLYSPEEALERMAEEGLSEPMMEEPSQPEEEEQPPEEEMMEDGGEEPTDSDQ